MSRQESYRWAETCGSCMYNRLFEWNPICTFGQPSVKPWLLEYEADKMGLSESEAVRENEKRSAVVDSLKVESSHVCDKWKHFKQPKETE